RFAGIKVHARRIGAVTQWPGNAGECRVGGDAFAVQVGGLNRVQETTLAPESRQKRQESAPRLVDSKRSVSRQVDCANLPEHLAGLAVCKLHLRRRPR